MSKYYLFQDIKKCIGCHACEIQCKSYKNLPIEPELCKIIQVGPKFIDGLPKISFVFMSCFHCGTPWCVSACPTGAMKKRARDGIVFIDKDMCVGCKACVSACPWGAPQWNEDTGKVEKCDFCMDRIDNGLKPACVVVCPTDCLQFGTVEETTRIRRERHASVVTSLDKK